MCCLCAAARRWWRWGTSVRLHTHITAGARPGLGQRCGLVSLGAFTDIGTLTVYMHILLSIYINIVYFHKCAQQTRKNEYRDQVSNRITRIILSRSRFIYLCFDCSKCVLYFIHRYGESTGQQRWRRAYLLRDLKQGNLVRCSIQACIAEVFRKRKNMCTRNWKRPAVVFHFMYIHTILQKVVGKKFNTYCCTLIKRHRHQ